MTVAARSAPAVPRIVLPSPRWHAISRPATDLSGDLYMLLEREGGWLFVLADVTGHGLGAAVYMLMIQEELERLAASSLALPDLVGALHETLLRELPERRFATGVFVELDPDGAIEVVNAGHCPPLLRRRDGVVESLPPDGPLVGALPRTRWGSRRSRLGPGEILAVFSDGLPEATSAAGQELGSARLEARLRSLGRVEPRDVAQALLSEADVFRGGLDAADDATVLVIAGS